MTAENPIWWTGPICGLGNRMMAIAAVRACAGERPVRFQWSNDASCPGAFEDVFTVSDGFAPSTAAPPSEAIATGWEPYEIFETFKSALGLSMSRAAFSARLLHALDTLPIRNVHVDVARAWREAQGAAPLIGVHVRRTDRTEQHRRQFQDFLMRKSGLNRELPVLLSAFYGLAPAASLCAYENAMLSSAVRRFGAAQDNHAYVIFADDKNEALNVEQALTRSVPNAAKREGPQSDPPPQMERLRATSLSAAMIDLLCLAQCDAIAQGNRASTFSLAAAIIGRKPILTAKTRYPFWRMLEEDLGVAPNMPPLTAPAD